jgi:Abnormal spindle-like microcephaly-assoc'd, ASPM-SPD-2-Hydin/PQQ enzyme repeat
MRFAACIAALTLAFGATTVSAALASQQLPQQRQQSQLPQQQARPADEDTISQNLLRDGWDPNEPGLSPATVQGGHFGQLFAAHVSGQVYAQPLVVDHAGTSTTAASSDVIVATEGDWVYSLDGTTGKANWSVRLGTPWGATVRKCNDIAPYIGITSAPVYDPTTGLLYLVALIAGSNYLTPTPTYYVYALNEQTGAIAWHVPVQGAATNAHGEVFAAAQERQRSGLLLMNGSLYFAFASFCDYGAYVGYVSGVNVTSSSHPRTLWSDETASGADQAGIWMSGSGLMSDGSGRIFLATGNGVSPPPGPGTKPPGELGDSVVRLAVQSNGSLTAADFFSPANSPTLAREDADWGSGGVVGLPFGTSTYPDLLIQVGKDGRVFLLNRDNLGGRETGSGGTDNPVFEGGPYGGQWAHPAAFAGTGGNDYVYVLGNGNSSNDYLRILKFNGSTPAHPTLTLLANSPGTFGYSSGSPVVTSNGGDPSSAVVWEVYTAGNTGDSARLEAFDAVPAAGQATLTQIWSAPISVSSKYDVPATDGGHVYVGIRDDGVHLSNATVYGFGVTNALPLTSTQVSFGSVGAGGAAKTLTASVTATRPLEVTGASVTSTASPVPFTLGQPAVNGTAVSFPVALTAGQQLTVPVSFAPTTAVAVTSSLDLTTNVPGYSTMSVPLAGIGTQAGLAALPASLPFGSTIPVPDTPFNGPVPIGGTQTFKVNIINTATTPETIAAVKPPAAPFSISGLTPGMVLQAGAAAVVAVTYTPSRATSSDAGSFTVGDSAGRTVTVPLTGISVPGNGALITSPSQVQFGAVRVGTSTTATVRITNTGNLPVTVTLFITPGGPFSTPVPIATNLTIIPDDLIALPVTLTPRTAGTFTGTFQIAATYGNGKTEKVALRVSGSGVG